MDFLYIIFWITLLYCSYKLKNDFVLWARMAFGIASDNAKTAGVSDRSEIEKTESSNANSDIVSFNRWRRILNCGWLIVAAIIAIPLIFSCNSRSSFSSEFIGNLNSFFKYERQISEIIMFLLGNIAVFSPIIAVCLLDSLTRRAIKKAFDVWQAVGSQRNELYQFGFPSDNSLKRTFNYSILVVFLAFLVLTIFIVSSAVLGYLVLSDIHRNYLEKTIFHFGFIPVLILKTIAAWFLVCLTTMGLWQYRAVEMKNAIALAKSTPDDLLEVKCVCWETVKIFFLLGILSFLITASFDNADNILETLTSPFVYALNILIITFNLSGSYPSCYVVYMLLLAELIFFVFELMIGLSILRFLYRKVVPSLPTRKGETLSSVLITAMVMFLFTTVLSLIVNRVLTPDLYDLVYLSRFLIRSLSCLFISLSGLVSIRLQSLTQKPKTLQNALAIALSLVVIALPF